jgi:predicted nucleic acid-binding protein
MGQTLIFFAPAIEATSELIIPAISVYEVFKRILQQRSESKALQAVAVMMRGRVVNLDVQLALTAARVSTHLRIPMADSIILATARLHSATLWAQDEHFEHIEGVQYIAKQGPGA